MSRSVAVVACDHGFGHVARCHLIADAAAKLGHSVTLFASRAKVEAVTRHSPVNGDFQIRDFLDSDSRHIGGFSRERRSRDDLRELERFDVVISDTVLEVVDVRRDVVLLSNFFWHSVVPDTHDDRIQEAARRLSLAPQILGSMDFAMDDVRRQPRFQGIGLVVEDDASCRSDEDTDHLVNILVSVGGSKSGLRLLKMMRPWILSLDLEQPFRVYGDAVTVSVLRGSETGGLQIAPFDYRPESYARLNAAVIRPGLGTVSRLLRARVPQLLIEDASSREMSHNAKVLRAMGAALQTFDPLDESRDLAASLSDTLRLEYAVRPEIFTGTQDVLRASGLLEQ